MVLLNGVDNVERLLILDPLVVLSHREGYAVHHLARFLVHSIELNMLLLLAYEFAGASIFILLLIIDE